jgi:dephospho-CoA kinase
VVVVGLTGGAGSGKTTVSRILAEKGAYIVDADQIARKVVDPGSPVLQEVVNRFGKEILCGSGTIDRKKLAGIVFCDPSKRALLNEILHPRILEEIERRIEEIGRQNDTAVIIIDAPLLIEMGYHRKMDKVIVVTATREQQVERLTKRDGMTPDQAQRILSSQLPLEEKLQAADFIIRNEGPLENTARTTEEIFKALQEIASRNADEASCKN